MGPHGAVKGYQTGHLINTHQEGRNIAVAHKDLGIPCNQLIIKEIHNPQCAIAAPRTDDRTDLRICEHLFNRPGLFLRTPGELVLPQKVLRRDPDLKTDLFKDGGCLPKCLLIHPSGRGGDSDGVPPAQSVWFHFEVLLQTFSANVRVNYLSILLCAKQQESVL